MKYLKHSAVLLGAVFATCALTSQAAQAQSKISKKNITFIRYPGFPEGTSTWDDIGYDSTYNKVIVAVTNHSNKQALYSYDVGSKKMVLKGIIEKMAHLRKFQRQGKVHSKFVEGPKGNMFFSTDGGGAREEYLMNHPRGYLGGFFMRWNPGKQKLTNLGMGLRFDSIKDVGIDPGTGNLYGISYPQVHFLVYNRKANRLRDLGRLGSSHVTRVLFTDWWGNCYYVDWRQRLVEYEKSADKLIFAKHSLPAFAHTPGTVIVTGITTFAKDRKHGIIYLITYGGKLVAFHPQKKGIGRVDDLGGVVDAKDLGPGVAPWRAYTPDMALAHNGKLYYVAGSEGRYVQKGKTLFVEFDPNTGQKRILFKYPKTVLAGATGSNVTDKEGNLYFAGYAYKRHNGHRKSVPFMVKFNPTKEVGKIER
jgi:hypothetical protein